MKKTYKGMLTAVLLVASALAQTKTLAIGKATYIGEDPQGNSAFTVNLTKNTKLVKQPQILDIVVYEQGQTEDTQAFGTVTPPAGFLFSFGPTTGLKNCASLCPMVNVQIILSNNQTTTFQLTDGETFTSYSILNAYILAPQGKASLQVGQSVALYLRAVQ